MLVGDFNAENTEPMNTIPRTLSRKTRVLKMH